MKNYTDQVQTALKAVIMKLEKCVDVARAEHYKLEQIKNCEYSCAMWQGIRIGLQDAIRIIDEEDIPSCYKEVL